LTGKLREGCTATDLVLTVTEMLRKKGVVGKFVEFYGPGLDEMALEDRATIANMAPEYGATCGFFPIDKEAVRYLKDTARKSARVALVEKYAKAQGLFRTAKSAEPVFTDTLALDMTTVESSLAGPFRPQDRVALGDASHKFASALIDNYKKGDDANRRARIEGTEYSIGHGDVVIAAITSCTNTSNPSVMIGAGLVARNAVKRGLKVRPWVKTSLAPGSQVVTDYLAKAGLDKPLSKLGFNLVGYGCTTCIGNSGPLPEPIADAITKSDLVTAAVLNLIDNAQRHGARSVTFSTPGANVLRVHDDGPGVDPGRRRELRAAIDAQDYAGRTGLGLMLADLVARAHGGDLSLPDSANGFAVELNLGPGEA